MEDGSTAPEDTARGSGGTHSDGRFPWFSPLVMIMGISFWIKGQQSSDRFDLWFGIIATVVGCAFTAQAVYRVVRRRSARN